MAVALTKRAEAESVRIIAAAFREHVAQVGGIVEVALREVAERPGLLLEAIDRVDWTREVYDTMADQLETGLTTTYGSELSTAQRKYVLDLTGTPSSVYARARAVESVVGIGDQTRRALRLRISETLLNGGTIADLTRDIRGMVGLTPRLAKAVDRRRVKLTESGLAPARVTRKVEAYRNKLLRYRARNIAQTEMIDARNQGILDGWRIARTQRKLPETARKRWLIGGTKVCPTCIDLAGRAPIPIDQPWVAANGKVLMRPGAHSSCRCALGLVR